MCNLNCIFYLNFSLKWELFVIQSLHQRETKITMKMKVILKNKICVNKIRNLLSL